jgi:hypothetical protein
LQSCVLDHLSCQDEIRVKNQFRNDTIQRLHCYKDDGYTKQRL